MKMKILAIIPLFPLLFAWTSLASDSSHHAAVENLDVVGEDESASIGLGDEILITLEVPLGASYSSNVPVAILEGEPIWLKDLTRDLASSHTDMGGAAGSLTKNYENVLNRVLLTKLIVLEARNIGLDELPSVKIETDAFSSRTLRKMVMKKHFSTVEVDPVELDDLYKKLSRELRLTTLQFKGEEDALAFEKEYKSRVGFDAAATTFIEQGRAEGDLDVQEYTRLRDLLPVVAQVALDLDVGSVSRIFALSGGYVLFRVEDSRFLEDPEVRREARQIILKPMLKQEASEYGEFLEKKHATIDEKLMEEAFEPKKGGGLFGLGKKEPVDREALLKDERVLATVHGDDPFVVTVGDLAAMVVKESFHKVKDPFEPGEDFDAKREILLTNSLFKKVAIAEAMEQGLDKTEEYMDAEEENTGALLFGSFIDKMVAPGVKITEEEVRDYYERHTDEFSSPKMLRLSGLAFYEKSDAKSALAKLRKSADFGWVSANSAGQVDKDTEDVLSFDKQLLSLTALPEGLHEAVEEARQGDAVLYADENGFHYVITADQVFEPQPETYEKVRDSIGRRIFGEKLEASLEEVAAKLREAYDLRIFVREFDS